MNNRKYLIIAMWLFVLTLIELFVFPRLDMGQMRVNLLLSLMTAKALIVALVYMNLKKEGWALKVAFFAPIPVAIYFIYFMLYDAAYVWRS